MAKKQPPRIHPGRAIKALEAFHEAAGFAVASIGSVAAILEGCETAVPADVAKELARRLRESEARVAAHWEMED